MKRNPHTRMISKALGLGCIYSDKASKSTRNLAWLDFYPFKHTNKDIKRISRQLSKAGVPFVVGLWGDGPYIRCTIKDQTISRG